MYLVFGPELPRTYCTRLHSVMMRNLCGSDQDAASQKQCASMPTDLFTALDIIVCGQVMVQLLGTHPTSEVVAEATSNRVPAAACQSLAV